MEIRHSSRDSKLERLHLLDIVHNAAHLIADSSLAPSKKGTLHDRERILFGQGFLAQSQIFVNETDVLLDDAGVRCLFRISSRGEWIRDSLSYVRLPHFFRLPLDALTPFLIPKIPKTCRLLYLHP